MPDIIDREYRSVPHEGKLYSRLVMDTSIRNAILERNAELKKNPGAVNDLSFGRLTMSMPELDWEHWKKVYPDLASQDASIMNAALAKFMRTSEAAPYLVR